MKKFFLFILLLNVQITISQWVQIGQFGNMSCLSITRCDSVVFAALDNGIYRTTNNGMNWSLVNNSYARTIASNDSIVYASTSNGVIKSTNKGELWIPTTLNGPFVWILEAEGSFVYAGTVNPAGSRGVYRSTNHGESWNFISFNDEYAVSLAIEGARVCVGTGGSGGKIYVSTNYGVNWSQTFFYSNNGIECLAANDSITFAGGGAKVYVSTNSGLNWNITALSNLTPYTLTTHGSNVFVGTNYGVYQSSNLGGNWFQRNEGLVNLNYQYIYSICFSGDYVFIGTYQYGVWRRSRNELISVSNISNKVPHKFFLHQNYPNPFNPVTNIKFDLPISGYVEIKIFDLLGREISTLVNRQMQPGVYAIDWDASNYPSGVYFYSMITGDHAESRKMILLK
jgi:photosystem II stability/assembly factor-like uncharacterized protein